jgi:hypothetical protein
MPLLGRNELSWNERYRRSLYHFLRDELECLLINEALTESYHAFLAAGKAYPFIETKMLKPRAKIIAREYAEQRHFIVIFNEGALPAQSKPYVCFLESNKITKENLTNLVSFDLRDVFNQRMRFFDDKDFGKLLRSLTQSDYAVLIQRDHSVKARYRYGLSHFHVRIDWPVAEAAADLGRHLRYISKDIYEKNEREGEILQQKLYEYYGFHHTVGGRRTAALVATRYMASFDFLSTVYVASSEARTLSRLSEMGIAKYVLIAVPNNDIEELSRAKGIKTEEFAAQYFLDRTPDYGVGIFLVTYEHNEHSTPPPDGRLREINSDYQWLNVDLQLLVPPCTTGDARPIPYSRVYT